MLELGLTGGIGSGKTTVGELLVAHGAVLIDADAIVRELQAPGSPVLALMAAEFGAHIIDEDGALDRQAVADVVFHDSDALERLNRIVHPAVRREMTARRRALADTDATVVLDIPLLVEGAYRGLGGVIVVDTPPEVAIERLVEHRGLSEDDARARMASQASRDERLALADFVIDNSGGLVHLAAEVRRCWEWIGTLERPEPGAPLAEVRIGSGDPD